MAWRRSSESGDADQHHRWPCAAQLAPCCFLRTHSIDPQSGWTPVPLLRFGMLPVLSCVCLPSSIISARTKGITSGVADASRGCRSWLSAPWLRQMGRPSLQPHPPGCFTWCRVLSVAIMFVNPHKPGGAPSCHAQACCVHDIPRCCQGLAACNGHPGTAQHGQLPQR